MMRPWLADWAVYMCSMNMQPSKLSVCGYFEGLCCNFETIRFSVDAWLGVLLSGHLFTIFQLTGIRILDIDFLFHSMHWCRQSKSSRSGLWIFFFFLDFLIRTINAKFKWWVISSCMLVTKYFIRRQY